LKVLVLGGTRFLGRHIVETLSAEKYHVVRFHRGKANCDLPAGAEERLGDRNGDLSSVGGESWDAIVDVSGLEPEQVARTVALGADRYAFISSLNAYSDLSRPGVREDAPTRADWDGAASDPDLRYGINKAKCEDLIRRQLGDRATVLRPGLIVGKWDYTGRFTYWCERVLRGGPVLVPGSPDRPVQMIDAADLAGFVALTLRRGLFGTFNMVGPRVRTTMQDVITACQTVAAERGAPEAVPIWADETFLRANDVQQWTEMPLWLADEEWAGLLQVSNAKALDAGLELRPLQKTIRAIIDWRRSSESADELRAGMSSEREALLLQKLDAHGGAPR
jgi:2'-hydroxyisoflavone reductase